MEFMINGNRFEGEPRPGQCLRTFAREQGGLVCEKAAMPVTAALAQSGWTAKRYIAASFPPSAPRAVVMGPHNITAARPKGSDLKLVCNTRAFLGKTTSIAKGIAAIPGNARSILVVSVDQPRPMALYSSLRTTVYEGSALIVVPDNRGRNGHPVALKGELRNRLLALDEERLGLRGLLNELACQIHRMPCDPELLIWNCNTPLDYQVARAWFNVRERPSEPDSNREAQGADSLT